MWKRLAILVVIILLPVSAVAHAKLFYRMSHRSGYWKVEIATPELTLTPMPTEIPIVEISRESTLTLEPTLTPVSSETPTEVPIPTPEATAQISTSSDITTTPSEEVL